MAEPSNAAIKIYARVRPLHRNAKLSSAAFSSRYNISPSLGDESKTELAFKIPKDMSAIINNSRENFSFQFEKVFDNSKQEELFDVVAKEVVDSVINGYNGTIFAYGQTGSGKTFTITGGAERYEDRGIIPRSIQYLFKKISQDQEHEYDVQISYLEIYNEIGYDLLDRNRDAKSLEDLPKVYIQEDSDDKMHLRNLSLNPAKTEEEALNLLFVGDTNKMIAETPSNPSSSRSHCLFIVTLTSRQPGSGLVRKSKLHLVDLAGSERVAKTGVSGQILKEAKHINLSLHYLEQVIIALHEKSTGRRSHVPYRNSMMTSVLRDSLGGNCMTRMIATVAVEDNLLEESISTCRFAQRVALISNKLTLNEELDPYTLIEKLKKEIERLRAELALARGGDVSNEPLPDYEIDRIKSMVKLYVDNDEDLVFGDYRKIACAFGIFKDLLLENRKNLGTSGADISEVQKLKELLAHRDNEIAILVQDLKRHETSRKQPFNESILSVQSSFLDSSTVYDSSNAEVAFEQFQQDHPSWEILTQQKSILKKKFSEAKALGESANNLRNEIKSLKEELGEHENPDEEMRKSLSAKMKTYKKEYAQLKELKIEIEHLQHLLEQGKIRIQRDYENYKAIKNIELDKWKKDSGKELELVKREISFVQREEESPERKSRKDNLDPLGLRPSTRKSVREDIKAFYKARDSVLEME